MAIIGRTERLRRACGQSVNSVTPAYCSPRIALILVLSPRRALSIPKQAGPARPHMRVAEAPSPIGLRQVTFIRF